MANRTDNFNRADSSTSLGTPSDGGSDWSALSGTWGITSNKAYNVSEGAQEVAVLESSLANVDTQFTWTYAGDNEIGLVNRAADDSNYILLKLLASGGSSEATIFKKVGGSFTQLATASATFASGDVIKFRSDSSNNHTAYQNGVAIVGPTTESAGSTNTKHGIRASIVSGASARFDDFSITELTSGPSVGALTLTGLAGSAVQSVVKTPATP